MKLTKIKFHSRCHRYSQLIQYGFGLRFIVKNGATLNKNKSVQIPVNACPLFGLKDAPFSAFRKHRAGIAVQMHRQPRAVLSLLFCGIGQRRQRGAYQFIRAAGGVHAQHLARRVDVRISGPTEIISMPGRLPHRIPHSARRE